VARSVVVSRLSPFASLLFLAHVALLVVNARAEFLPHGLVINLSIPDPVWASTWRWHPIAPPEALDAI